MAGDDRATAAADVAGVVPPAPPGYAAFISYRHVEPDRRWAKWLHGVLETYRVPKRLAKERNLPRRVGRVFRDEEELPASAELKTEIDTALVRSKFLIVVCSPRTPQSLWVNREVERFRELGRHGQILALLVEGDPRTSFPPALKEIRRTVTDAEGMTREEIEEVEPLAADVRPERKERKGHLGNMAKLRLLACLLGVSFDDLRRRDHERKVRRLYQLGAVMAAVAIAMGVLATVAVMQSKEARYQRGVAEANAVRARDAQRRAEVRTAESLVLQADALALAGRHAQSKSVYHDAAAALAALGLPTFPADSGHWAVDRVAITPVFECRQTKWPALAVAFSPDGRLVASGGGDRTLRIWDAPTGRVQSERPGLPGAIRAVAFAPDGQGVAAAGSDGAVRVWDLRQPATAAPRVLAGHGPYVSAVAFAADGSLLASGGKDKTLRLWDARTFEFRRAIELPRAIEALAFFPDNRRLAVLADQLRVIDGTTGQTVRTYRSRGAALAVSADGAHVLTEVDMPETGVARLAVVDANDGRRVRVMPGHPGGAQVSGVAFLGRGNGRAVSAGWDRTARLWDLSTGKETRAFQAHEGWVLSLAATADGRRVVTGGYDRNAPMKLWDVDAAPPALPGEAFDVSPDGRCAVARGGDRLLRVVDLATGADLRVLDDSASSSRLVRFTGRGYAVRAHVPHASAVVTWDASTGRGDRVAAGAGWLAASPDGRLIASVQKDALIVRDAAANREAWRAAPGHVVELATFSADGRVLLAYGASMTGMSTWDAATGRKLAAIDAAGPGTGAGGAQLQDAAITPDGRFVVSATNDDRVVMWDAMTGALVRVFTSDGARLTFVAVAPDASWVAAAPDEDGHGGVWFWDGATGRLIRTIDVGGREAGWLRVSGDGLALLRGGAWPVAFDFARPGRERALVPRVEAARAALDASAGDVAALVTLGEWHAHRYADAWAVELFDRARAAGGGAAVPALELAHCYRRLGRGADAAREYRRAKAENAAPAEYLDLCVAAAERAGK